MPRIREKNVSYDPETGEEVVYERNRYVPDEAQEREMGAAKGNQIIWLVLGIITTILALRILFLIAGARAVGFAAFLYNLTDPLVAPFRGIFPAPSGGGAFFDTAALVAIIVYTLVGWVLMSILNVLLRPTYAEGV